MKILVYYIYGDLHDIKEGTVIINADIHEEMDAVEINNIFKPLIAQKTGNTDVKIMSYKELS